MRAVDAPVSDGFPFLLVGVFVLLGDAYPAANAVRGRIGPIFERDDASRCFACLVGGIGLLVGMVLQAHGTLQLVGSVSGGFAQFFFRCDGIRCSWSLLVATGFLFICNDYYANIQKTYR